MDRRSFLRGLAASTAAVPIANIAAISALAPPMPYYGWSPAMTALEELRKLDELRRAHLLANPILVVG